jgi:hypothetical protein
MNHLSDSQLNEYLDGTLTANVLRAIGAHLESCDSCRMRLGEFQLVFDRLANLSEAPLSHDLTPGIMTRLPQKRFPFWTPVFAVQFGVVLGVLVWFSSEAARIFKPPMIATPALSEFEGFHLPQITLSQVTSLFPIFNMQPLTINFLLMVPKFQFHVASLVGPDFHITVPYFQYWINQLPALQVPLYNIPSYLISGTVLVLWIVGNVVLLCGHSGAKK